MIESESYIKCTKCTIFNNFAISNGIVTATGSGRFELINSTMHNNYAMQNSIGKILVTSVPSILSNTEIYSNENIDIAGLNQELAS